MSLTKKDLESIETIVASQVPPIVERIVAAHVDELARTVQEDVVSQMATRGDVTRLEERLERIDRRLDHIERTILADHAERIKRIEDALVIPPKSKLRAAA